MVSIPSPRERALERAALDFIHKVDRGEARSKRSYAAFKEALDADMPDKKVVHGDTYQIARSSGDRRFLEFIYSRLVDRHGESPDVDYMRTLQEFVDKINELVNKARAMDMVLAAMRQFSRWECT